MALTLYNLIKAGLLVTNGVAILHPQRFLAKHNLDKRDMISQGSMRNQIVDLLQAIQWLKVPLIIINILFILIELVAG